MLKEFKEFAMKGNVVDMAIGIIIGAEFGKIINSMVNDIILPPIGMLLGKMDFSMLAIQLGESGARLRYGAFIQALLNFVIIAFAIFLMIKAITRFKHQPPPPTSTSRECPKCVSVIPKKASRCAFCTSEVAPAA